MLLRLLLGRLPVPPGHVRVRGLFLSGLGVVYVCAFASLWTQVHGLIGSNGIAPIGDTLDRVEAHLGGIDLLRFPTLLWIDSSDRALHVLCGGGVALSLLLASGFARLPCLVLLWAAYLSLFTAGLMFLSFQWDTLLLESGFLAIFLAPASLTPWGARGHEASKLALWGQRYLLFRLMFASGVVKLTSGDRSWWPDLTAMTFHYETQPLPTWTSWHVHHLPLWFHKAEVLLTFFVELVVPFLIFLGRRPRLVAFLCIAVLQVTIAFTGNYGFFNLLTLVLALTLLDDAMLSRKEVPAPAPPLPLLAWARRTALAALILLATLEFSAGLGWDPWPPRGEIDALRLTSSYGLFRVMTKERPEIVVEGSRDGREWKPYGFKWKPGDLDRAPGFVGPHMPRLDWQMWFAALSSYERTHWFGPFLRRLLDNEPAVVGLLAENPFPDEPPRYVRATLYAYKFTTPEERAKTGAWWKRTEVEPYTPMLFRR
ncbi:MAG: lipase maturation factor family protein [Planctomycetota bacterium]